MSVAQRLTAVWQLNRTYPVLVGLLFISALSLYLILADQVTPQLNAQERRFIDLQSQSRNARQLETDQESPKNLYQQRLADLEGFHALVPQEKEFTSLIAEIFKLADDAGLNISRVGYAPELIKGQNLLEYGLSFAVSGDYQQLKKFIYLLEKSSRLIAIESLTLVSKGADEGGITLQLKLTTYFQADRS